MNPKLNSASEFQTSFQFIDDSITVMCRNIELGYDAFELRKKLNYKEEGAPEIYYQNKLENSGRRPHNLVCRAKNIEDKYRKPHPHDVFK